MIDLLFDSWLLLGVTTLKKYKEERQYGDAANLLEGLNEVILHFQSYSEIPQIKDLALQVKGLQNEFGDQIINDFHVAFAAENARSFSPNRQLAEACLVISVLDPKFKRNLLKFILGRQLAEYSIGNRKWIFFQQKRISNLKYHFFSI